MAEISSAFENDYYEGFIHFSFNKNYFPRIEVME